MQNIYTDILKAITQKERLLAVLIDPDKFDIKDTESFIKKVNISMATHIFVGGSEVNESQTEALVIEVKKQTPLPVVLFPGDINQITGKADAILFLSLISGRNPDYLIGKHVDSISKLRHTELEIIPTGYMLISTDNSEKEKGTSVERISETIPLPSDNVDMIRDTAKAGELLGMKLIYLEAGSGVTNPVDGNIISRIKEDITLPLIVGGGIRNIKQLNKAYNAGANMVVVGTAFEEDEAFFEELNNEL